ncbi:hypothetical protein RI129_009950 [Pyrocoelia pectoralis]|uniref:ubiquitinyl hydrolase 1 n=1 Tax=Pyrocoelia pectoralis TaxID=417401 RepID=A0AAN7V9F0_9COLE
MSKRTYNYGILTQFVVVIDVVNKPQNERTGLLGSIVKIEGVLGNNTFKIRFLKDDHSENWESNKFCCKQSVIISVKENVWPYLASVRSPQKRIQLAKNPNLCEQLMQIPIDGKVGILYFGVVLVEGVLKFKGYIKGLGKGFGIRLHEKKINNKCNGTCAGIQYFTCPPGYGIFTTIERVVPRNLESATVKRTKKLPFTILENFTEKNVADISIDLKDFDVHSVQDILDSNSVNTITHNDFDQNTIIQSDNTHLIQETGNKLNGYKPEIDVIEAIGGIWPGSSSQKELGKPNLKRSYSNAIGSENGEADMKLNRSNPDVTVSSTTLIHYYSRTPEITNDVTVGSSVKIINNVSADPLYRVIRWISTKEVVVGVELEEEKIHLPLTLTDGIHHGPRLFECAENRSILVPINQCSRFAERAVQIQHVSDEVFSVECPIVKGAVAPLCIPTEEDVEAVCGKFKGIQGHNNSCYLDVTLFAMFAFTAVFDSLLFRPKGPGDIPDYEKVQEVLREEIVNPLRTKLFVRADCVMNLRKLLDQFSSVSGLTSDEKDPEEFLNALLVHTLKAEPFLKLSSGQETYNYQLFVEKDDGLMLPTVQQLFEQSFLIRDIKLKEAPSCLIIQMPRIGKNYKMYPRILPSQVLDITDIIKNSPRQCTVCGKVAKWECKECFGECGKGLESTAFCTLCMEKVHSHNRRSSHSPKKISVLHDYFVMGDHCQPPRLFMELFAVICIETSHYVAFVKCGVGHEAPWCFFDSMADSKGEQNAYNIPEMVACPDVPQWLSNEQSCRSLHQSAPLDRNLPEHARRLLCDAYMCMYQRPDR